MLRSGPDLGVSFGNVAIGIFWFEQEDKSVNTANSGDAKKVISELEDGSGEHRRAPITELILRLLPCRSPALRFPSPRS